MASSSRPFQSQTVSRLLAGYRNLRHGAKTLFRNGRIALLWGVQVAVFPAYVAFQSIRTGYRRLQSKSPWQRLKGLLTGKLVREIPVTADTPIRALLSAIQPRLSPKNGGLRPVNDYGSFLRQSHVGGVLTNGGWHLVPVKEPIRGIASDLVTRELVLVTSGNIIFEGLTEDQRTRLESAIALLLAEYAAVNKQSQWKQLLRQHSLPLPKAEPTQWFVVRWLQRGMRWLQTGGLATMTNLFGEAHQRDRRRRLKEQLLGWHTTQPARLVDEPPGWMQPKAFLPPDIRAKENRLRRMTVTSDSTQPQPFSLEMRPFERLEQQPIMIPSESPSESLEAVGADLNWPDEIDTLEARVSSIDYIDHWFTRLLRWIDQALWWLEETAKRIWQNLRR